MKTTHSFCSLNLTAICSLATALAGLVLTTAAQAAEVPGPWPTERANAWYAQQPWLVGCNFLPSTAVNDVEMWEADSFDAATIERELGWARDLGFNTVRVFLNYVVWEADAEGLKQRFDRFLAIADRLGIRAMPVLFDDCNFAGRVAAVRRQPDPVPGVHNSQWVSSPPLAMVTDQAAWQQLERYVKDLVGVFANDRRVVVWDLYNEPGNSGMGSNSRPLMEAAFAWARDMKPSQPLTVGAWTDFQSPLSRRMMELSDVVSFHGYDGRGGIETKLKTCGEYGRPVLCTEWLFRQGGNRFETLLPLFRDRQIGCYNWGLVAGRTQTYFHWGSPKDAPEPAVWQHDILRRDGTPYREREVAMIRYLTGASKTPPPLPAVAVPTAEREAILWRCTMEPPASDWFQPGFDDSAWTQSPAPFGRVEPDIGRQPRTPWTGADIWLRREFDMPAKAFSELALIIHHDEDVEVFLDGVLAAKLAGFNAAYESCPLTPEAAALLKPGKHLWAVHCRQTAGGQFIDVGIEGVPRDAK
jgi:hypothetical protein